MKIEIDLDDIFRDDEGEPSESLQDSIRRQVIEKLSGDMRKRMFARIDTEISEIMTKQISEVMKEKMPELIDDIMNVTYTPVSTYGARGEPTTFRDQIIKSVADNMKYQPKESSYDENAFTKAVKSIVVAQTNATTKDLATHINQQFAKDALAAAVKMLSERLGLTKA